MTEKIDSFRGKYRFLSNFYPAEVSLPGDAAAYPTVEHAFQAYKTVSSTRRLEIRRASTPGGAKRLGRQLVLRPDWKVVRLGIMDFLVRQKFSKEPLRSMLLDTGNAELIEGNWWGDVYWGVCNGEGENHLGKILMSMREELRRAHSGT